QKLAETSLLVCFFSSSSSSVLIPSKPYSCTHFVVCIASKFSNSTQTRSHIEGADGEMQYDAFLSFCRQDEAWVLGEMDPRLEEQGNPRLMSVLCLHNRDFEMSIGYVIHQDVSIYSSQCTVCLISRRYLRSDWCSLEIRVATHRQLEDQKHRLILIFLEHISPFELSAFHRLARLVRSRTYLDWPEDEARKLLSNSNNDDDDDV
uniref:TIR domain-containing protein n=1 Tax=Sinocyclocheilus rhinocerous TaxID=307959 RepID=A0A673JDP4_9TELE